MHGLGNDFVVIDARETGAEVTAAAGACAGGSASPRGGGLRPAGGDPRRCRGRGQTCDWCSSTPTGRFRAACGNATRCIAPVGDGLPARGFGLTPQDPSAGLLQAEDAGGGLTSVNMGQPVLDCRACRWPRTWTSTILPIPGAPVATGMGNPHCTFFVDDAEAVDLAADGPRMEHHPLFPERTKRAVRPCDRPRSPADAGVGARHGHHAWPRARRLAQPRWRRRGGG